MQLTREIIIDCCQSSINAYGGAYGTVHPEIFESNENHKIDHTEFIFSVKKDVFYITFEGSHGKKDWYDNLKFRQVPSRNLVTPYKETGTNTAIRIHDGFYEQFLKVRGLIHDAIRSMYRKKIIATGHSLGAALATLCALDIQYNFPDIDIACVNFGSPRVGNRAFIDSFNKRVPNTLRYVYKNDIVCLLPPLLFGYRHVNAEMRIGTREWYRPVSFILGNVMDHYPERYLEWLVKN